jgi:hypothetical protein
VVDLDELDRLHAALKSGQIEAVIVGQAREVVTLLRAYPALAAELKGTRRMEAEALLALAKVADLLSENGCDCECGHHYEEHDDDCERCLACRVEDACFTRSIRDAIHEVPR